MTSTESIEQINAYYGSDWFNEFFANATPAELALPLEEKIRLVYASSIHGQTEFFRDHTMLAVFKECVMPALPEHAKVASVGCATGEEVYSLLLDNWHSTISLDGYESDSQRVEKAKSGNYNFWTGSISNRERLEELRTLENIAFSIEKTKRYDVLRLQFTQNALSRAQFETYNVLHQPLPKKYDAIILSNVLWHYATAGRERILSHVYASLNDGGFLLCERNAAWPEQYQYNQQMKDISHLGFAKRETVIKTWYSDRDNVTCFTKLYRKS
jgi:chemotaxis methyl-accepting protein methylase